MMPAGYIRRRAAIDRARAAVKAPLPFKLAPVPERAQNPAMEQSQVDLELAIKHVIEAEALVAEQRLRIDRLKSEGKPTEQSELLLQAMQGALSRMKSQLASLTDPVKGGNLSN
jgi:hypothetical protein